jgi:hypothetical protein
MEIVEVISMIVARTNRYFFIRALLTEIWKIPIHKGISINIEKLRKVFVLISINIFIV